MSDNRPHDTEAEELASQILHSLRKPRELLDESDKEYIIDTAEDLATEVLEDD